MHVHALDRAAALPGVVHRAVDDVLDRLLEIAVGRDVGGVVASELEARVEEALRRRLDDAVPAEDRAGEDDVVDALVADNPLARRVIAVERLDEVRRGTRRPRTRGRSAPPQRGVRGLCFRTTALPARTAGTTQLTAVSSG